MEPLQIRPGRGRRAGNVLAARPDYPSEIYEAVGIKPFVEPVSPKAGKN